VAFLNAITQWLHCIAATGTNPEGLLQVLGAFLPKVSPSIQTTTHVPLGRQDAKKNDRNRRQQQK
jgi:hypothetical protein